MLTLQELKAEAKRQGYKLIKAVDMVMERLEALGYGKDD